MLSVYLYYYIWTVIFGAVQVVPGILAGRWPTPIDSERMSQAALQQFVISIVPPEIKALLWYYILRWLQRPLAVNVQQMTFSTHHVLSQQARLLSDASMVPTVGKSPAG